MKHILEYFPLLAFFLAYYLFDVYVATSVLMAATLGQLILLKILFGQIQRQHWLVFVTVTIFGTLTLYFHNDDFIKLKASIIYSVLALILLGYQYIGQSLPKKLMGNDIAAPDVVWRNISYGWAASSLLAASANYWIAFNFSLDVWVNFKVFGLMGLTFIMFIITGIYLYKYMPSETTR